MAHVTGQVNDLASLRTAIINACTANGWALNTNVLSKGTVFIELTILNGSLFFLGGLGIDVSDNLTTPGTSSPSIGDFAQAITYPVTYEVHINTAPDEVFVVINYNVDFWQWAAWGLSNVVGLPGGGVWYAASRGDTLINPIREPGGNGFACHKPWLFPWRHPQTSGAVTANSFIHHGFDGGGWNLPVNAPQPNAWEPASPLQYIQPNEWNDEAVLIPIQVWMPRTSGSKVSLAADIQNARYLRIDFLDPGQIINLGPDAWKVYPAYRKDASDRDAGSGSSVLHTGTFGWAVRYTGL